jgi:hypothetical protein
MLGFGFLAPIAVEILFCFLEKYPSTALGMTKKQKRLQRKAGLASQKNYFTDS